MCGRFYIQISSFPGVMAAVEPVDWLHCKGQTCCKPKIILRHSCCRCAPALSMAQCRTCMAFCAISGVCSALRKVDGTHCRAVIHTSQWFAATQAVWGVPVARRTSSPDTGDKLPKRAGISCCSVGASRHRGEGDIGIGFKGSRLLFTPNCRCRPRGTMAEAEHVPTSRTSLLKMDFEVVSWQLYCVLLALQCLLVCQAVSATKGFGLQVYCLPRR